MLCDVNITREAVMKEIDKLKKTKSPGPDDIYPRVLKETKDIISEPLANIFRKSVDTGIVPTKWKKANVVPIFKKGDKSVMSNYRPISLTSIVGKLLESIIAKTIRSHLEKHNLIKFLSASHFPSPFIYSPRFLSSPTSPARLSSFPYSLSSPSPLSSYTHTNTPGHRLTAASPRPATLPVYLLTIIAT